MNEDNEECKRDLLHDFDEANQCVVKEYKFICECGVGRDSKWSQCKNNLCYHHKYYIFERDYSKVKYVQFKLQQEDFLHLFENYSSFEAIKDKTFHRKRLKFLKAKEELDEYISMKASLETEQLKMDHRMREQIRLNV